eukprot:RCo046232
MQPSLNPRLRQSTRLGLCCSSLPQLRSIKKQPKVQRSLSHAFLTYFSVMAGRCWGGVHIKSLAFFPFLAVSVAFACPHSTPTPVSTLLCFTAYVVFLQKKKKCRDQAISAFVERKGTRE